jgi:hypothetical protein
MKQHTTPCKECCFRRASLPGWVGNHSSAEFAALAMSERRMPCHMKVDYQQRDWRTVQQSAPQCAGRATLWRNMCKLPRNRELLVVKQTSAAVFQHIREFIVHHTDGEKAWHAASRKIFFE